MKTPVMRLPPWRACSDLLSHVMWFQVPLAAIERFARYVLERPDRSPSAR